LWCEVTLPILLVDATHALNCRSVSGEMRLVADSTVLCGSTNHIPIVVGALLALVVVVLVVFGLPAGFQYQRQRLRPEARISRLFRRSTALFAPCQEPCVAPTMVLFGIVRIAIAVTNVVATSRVVNLGIKLSLILLMAIALWARVFDRAFTYATHAVSIWLVLCCASAVGSFAGHGSVEWVFAIPSGAIILQLLLVLAFGGRWWHHQLAKEAANPIHVDMNEVEMMGEEAELGASPEAERRKCQCGEYVTSKAKHVCLPRKEFFN
jgi:hypothetical protein